MSEIELLNYLINSQTQTTVHLQNQISIIYVVDFARTSPTRNYKFKV